jgi:polysaccharide biosynthesis transport protein
MSKIYDAIQKCLESPQALLPGTRLLDDRSARFDHVTISAAQSHKSEWRRYLDTLKAHWRLSAICAALVFFTVTVVAFTQKPVYEPTATVEIDPPGVEPFSQAPQVSDSDDTEYLATQAKNMESDELAVAVIRSLHLDQRSDFVGTGKVSLLSRLNVFRRFAKPQKDSLAQGTDEVAGAPQLSKTENAALRSFRSNLTVTRDTGSRLVSVKFASYDPRLAALVTNTLVNSFIDRSYKTRHDTAMQSSTWLSKQLDDVREAMQSSNGALAEYEKAWVIVDLGEDEKQQSTFSQKIAELTTQLAQAQAERIQLESYLNEIKAGNGDSLQQVGDDPVSRGITAKLADVRTALAESVVVYGQNHTNVKKLQNQADELEAQLKAQRQAILGRIQTSYGAAQAREHLLSQEMNRAMGQVGHMGQYNVLKKEAQGNRELYNALYARVREAGISAESKSINIRLMDPARILDSPTRPDRLLIVAVGFFVALLGGAMIAVVKEGFDSTIHNPDDLRMLTGISAISIIPTFESKWSSGAMMSARNLGLLENRMNCQTVASQRLALERHGSPEAEALQGLHTSIMLHRRSNSSSPPQVIQMVSSFPGEGKTTLAVNMAVALSKHGKTCLVDADLRRPAIANWFGLHPKQGLGEVLMGSASVKEVVTDLRGQQNLSVLPACVLTGDPGQLFLSPSMQMIVRALRQQFQYVVIDSPPIIPYAEGRAIASLADGLVLVGRDGLTTREAMARSIELLAHVNAAPIIEVVLNAAGHMSLESRYRYGNN